VSARTSTGLPKRVRQANLAPQLREPTPPADDSAPAEPASSSLLTSFRAGWRRAEEENVS
jgi:hypothetical protein